MDLMVILVFLAVSISTKGQVKLFNNLLVQHYNYGVTHLAFLTISYSIGSIISVRVFEKVVDYLGLYKLLYINALIFLEIILLDNLFLTHDILINVVFILLGSVSTIIYLCVLKIINYNYESYKKGYGFICGFSGFISSYFIVLFIDNYVSVFAHTIVIAMIILLSQRKQKPIHNNQLTHESQINSIMDLMIVDFKLFIYYITFLLHESLLQNYWGIIWKNFGISPNTIFKLLLTMRLGSLSTNTFNDYFSATWPLVICSMTTIVILILWIITIAIYGNYYCPAWLRMFVIYFPAFLLGIIFNMKSNVVNLYEKKKIYISQKLSLDLENYFTIISFIIAAVSDSRDKFFGLANALIIIHSIFILIMFFQYIARKILKL